MRVLIVGGGAIGTSIAYHLAARGADVIVIERSAIACAASGKSGGFLAMDWCDGTPLMHLARRSFALHAELAEGRDGEWGYRRMTTYGGVVGRPSTSASRGARPGWVSPNVSINGQLGSMGTTAQVQPAAFTAGMMRAAEARGAELRLGSVTGLLRRGGDVVGVDLDGEALEGDAVVIAMGPWSVLAAQWLPLPPVFGLKGHSLVFETGTAIPSEALFLEYAEADRLDPLAGDLSACRWHHVCVCDLERLSPPGRSWSRRSRRWCDRQVESTLRSYLTDTGIVPCSREPSVLSPGDAGRTPADRRHPGRTRRVCGNRP